MQDQETWTLGVADLAAAYAEGRTNPVNVIEDLLVRIERLNPSLNAYVALAPDATSQAEESRARIRSGTPRSALEGVPLAVKDNLSVAGMPAAWGSAVYGDRLRENDELPIARLREAGAILIGKTNTPEFAVEGYTANARFGVTRNPWDLDLTPGGSSGGTVAAVAAGLAAGGIGTDGGGSIRRPAGHTGLFGLKPGRGVVARGGGLPQILMDFEVVGPVARSARDLTAIYAVLAGPERSDPASRSIVAPSAARKRLKVLSVERFGDHPCDPGIRASFAAMGERLRILGHEVVEGPLPLNLAQLDAFWGRFAQIGLAHMVRSVPGMADKAGERYLAMAREGAAVPATDLFAAIEAVGHLRAEVSRLFGEWDLVMTPTAAAQPWPAERSHPEVIDGQSAGPRGHAIYTGWVNACGHPAIALPASPDAAGVPIGVQIIGDLGSEVQLISLAHRIETEGEGWSWPAFAKG